MSTGHWLDALLGGSQIQIEWSGALVPKQNVWAFSDDFAVTDDPALGKTLISLAGPVGIALDGDVTGDADENRVTTISGDEEDAQVTVFATKFFWDDTVSEGEAELSISTGGLDAGALALRHDNKDVFVAVSNAPRLGNTTAIGQWLGGARFTTRTVSTAAVTLDTTTRDMLVHVNASAERMITVPAATDGRTIIFMIAGASLVTIKRAGSELINGSPSNYIVPFPDACVVLTSVGGNWLARSFADAIPTTGGGTEVDITRRIDVLAPLVGGGDLSADRTLGISEATTSAVGVIKLAANLAGTGLLPLVTGLTADTISVQNADASHKGVWTTTGLRVGDNTAPTERLEVLGRASVGPGTAKVTLGGYPTLENSYATLWLGPSAPSPTNYTLFGNGAGETRFNAPAGQRQSFRFGHSAIAMELTETGLRLGNDGAAPTEKLEVIGRAVVGSGLAKAIIGSFPGFENSYGAVWVGPITPTATNYAFFGNGSTDTLFNAPLLGGRISFRFAHSTIGGEITSTGLRLASDGAAPTDRLEVLGRANIGVGASKVRIDSFPGAEATQSAIWLGTAAPSTTNYFLQHDVTFSRTRISSPGNLHICFNGVDNSRWTSTGLRIGDVLATPANRLEVVGSTRLDGDFRCGISGGTNVHNLWGSITTQVRSTSGDVTIDSGQSDLSILVDATASSRAITLPTPTAGRIIWVKRTAGTNNVNVNRSGGAFVESSGFVTARLVTDPAASGIHPYVALQGNGVNWFVIRHFSMQLATS